MASTTETIGYAVIGAGLVGAAAAYHWSKHGDKPLLVVEMNGVASGSAGRNEGLVVMGQVVAGVTVDDLRVGQEMELVVDVLFSDDETDHLIWKWKPVASSTAASLLGVVTAAGGPLTALQPASRSATTVKPPANQHLCLRTVSPYCICLVWITHPPVSCLVVKTSAGSCRSARNAAVYCGANPLLPVRAVGQESKLLPAIICVRAQRRL